MTDEKCPHCPAGPAPRGTARLVQGADGHGHLFINGRDIGNEISPDITIRTGPAQNGKFYAVEVTFEVRDLEVETHPNANVTLERTRISGQAPGPDDTTSELWPPLPTTPTSDRPLEPGDAAKHPDHGNGTVYRDGDGELAVAHATSRSHTLNVVSTEGWTRA